MVASADGLATQAGLAVLGQGGSAADAAIATNAMLAVTAPHLCGMGGDLFALVHDGSGVHTLDASGAAASGSDAAALRAEGHTSMPFRHDIRTVTVPGCVDGWVELHRRFGCVPLADVLAPAIRVAQEGFPASPLLVASIAALDEPGREQLHELAAQANRTGARVRRPGVARTLRAISSGGRDAFYEGEFGAGLLELGAGHFTPTDLATHQARWVTPLAQHAFGHQLWTVPPPSQGYLVLGGALLAHLLDLPDDPDDAAWAHLLIEAAAAAGHDRPDRLHDGADGPALLADLATRTDRIDRHRASLTAGPTSPGDTTYLCAVDGDRLGVSLIQSNAAGFGSWLAEQRTGINLHNRGLGFSLVDGHPAVLAPGRHPPHTLSPVLVTRDDGTLAAVLGTMGGDAQPQILLQLLTRLLSHGHSPARAVGAARWVLRGPDTGFDTWTSDTGPVVQLERHASPAWHDGLAGRGHRVEWIPPFDSGVGHAHVIQVGLDGMLAGAADPRALVGSCAGI